MFNNNNGGYNGCGNNGVDGSMTNLPTTKCWGGAGSIDVEDLAMLFGDTRVQGLGFNTKSNATTNHRVSRNRQVGVIAPPNDVMRNSESYIQFHNSTTNNDKYYGCGYERRCYLECGENSYPSEHRVQKYYNGHFVTDRGRHKENAYEHALPLGLGISCTEDQWLACPVTNCLIYDNVNNAISSIAWQSPIDYNGIWNLNDNNTDFGPSLPACMINGTYDTHSYNSIYRPCYYQSEEGQQFFEDYL